ncbi:MAG: hypothetical protein LBL45_07170, partial [Treponema sp.]|nr:hypothetical protein [Treponema sp.]
AITPPPPPCFLELHLYIVKSYSFYICEAWAEQARFFSPITGAAPEVPPDVLKIPLNSCVANQCLIEMTGWTRTQADAERLESRSMWEPHPALTQETCPYERFDCVAVIVKKRCPKPARSAKNSSGFGPR